MKPSNTFRWDYICVTMLFSFMYLFNYCLQLIEGHIIDNHHNVKSIANIPLNVPLRFHDMDSIAFITTRQSVSHGYLTHNNNKISDCDSFRFKNISSSRIGLANSNNLSTTIKGKKISNVHPVNSIPDTTSLNKSLNDRFYDNKLFSFNYDNIKSVINNLSILGLWYAGTVLYNIENKKALNIFPLPRTVAALQMYVSLPLIFTRWFFGLKSIPKINVEAVEDNEQRITGDDTLLNKISKSVSNKLCYARNFIKAYKSVIMQSGYFSLLHLLSVTALSAGAVGFVHIVKASEPIFASIISLVTGTVTITPLTFLTLLPIVGGVALSSMKEVNFSATALVATLTSNIFSSFKRIEAKRFFNQDLNQIGSNITPSNIYSLITIFSTIMLTPLALTERERWNAVYNFAMGKYGKEGSLTLLRHVLLSGLYYALYNEVSFIALSKLSPITHAVASTIKRIFLIMTSVVIFNAKLTPQGLYGSAMALIGALLYSLSK